MKPGKPMAGMQQPMSAGPNPGGPSPNKPPMKSGFGNPASPMMAMGRPPMGAQMGGMKRPMPHMADGGAMGAPAPIGGSPDDMPPPAAAGAGPDPDMDQDQDQGMGMGAAVSPEAVHYHDDAQSCQMCQHMGPDGTCAVLKMQVSPDGGCAAYEGKAQDMDQDQGGMMPGEDAGGMDQGTSGGQQ